MALVKELYRVTSDFSKEETFGLVDQMRRAAVLIPANLAEGHTRQRVGEYRYFVSVALGSVAELETHILLSDDLAFLVSSDTDNLLKQLDEIGKMLRGLAQYLDRRRQSTT